MDDENAVLGINFFQMFIDSIAGYTKAARNKADIAAGFSPCLFNQNACFHTHRRGCAFGAWRNRCATKRCQYDLGKIKTDNVKLGISAEFIILSAKKLAGAIQADVTRMEDFGNYRLITVQVGDMVVKAKAKREAALPTDKVWVTFPAERCCVYADEVLV